VVKMEVVPVVVVLFKEVVRVSKMSPMVEKYRLKGCI
jgi:hypothetical protein